MSVEIKIENVVKRYGDNTVIPNLDLLVNEGEFLTLLGPSGCGKTTLLRMIAGFNSIEGGTISFDNEVINEKPVHRRNIGMVFQNYAIFPHLNTFDNVAYGLKNQKVSKGDIDKKVDQILKTVQIDDLSDRMPQNMSGGQQQRVALARAIVTNPSVLLMDEPLSNLDAKLRIEMRYAIKEIHDDLGITTIYVTHDQEEALAMSDRIAIMNKGVIQQIGSPEEIYRNPYNLFVGTFIGRSNVFEFQVIENRIEFSETLLLEDSELNVSNYDKLKILLRPNELMFSETEGIECTITQKNFLGEVTQYVLKSAKDGIIELDQDDYVNKGYSIGEKIFVKPISNNFRIFDSNTNESMKFGDLNEA